MQAPSFTELAERAEAIGQEKGPDYGIFLIMHDHERTDFDTVLMNMEDSLNDWEDALKRGFEPAGFMVISRVTDFRPIRESGYTSEEYATVTRYMEFDISGRPRQFRGDAQDQLLQAGRQAFNEAVSGMEAAISTTLRNMPDSTIMASLDFTECHVEQGTEEIEKSLTAAMTAMFVRRLRAERDRRLTATSAKEALS